MAQSSQTGSQELSYNSAALPPRGKGGRHPSLPLTRTQKKKRKLEAFKMNACKRQTIPPARQVTTYMRFAILETTEDSMDTTEAINRQHTQRTPTPYFIDDAIDIQTMTNTIERDISREDYKLIISNSSVKILPTNRDAYRKLLKLLKTLNANFHTY